MHQQPKNPPPSAASTRTHAVAAGSVWETRMKMDQIRGGIKVFHGADPPDQESTTPSPPPTHRKRKNWKQPEPQSDPIELRRALSELAKAPKSDPTSFTVDDGEVDLCEDVEKIDEIGKVAPMHSEVDEKDEEEDFEDSLQERKNRLQSIVDLLMWRDVSRSALVFGVGGFLLISSSFARNLNLSLISAISFVGLVYLALIFLYRSFLCREEEDKEIGGGDERWVIGEEEAIWVIKIALPYMNEALLKLRSLFSGDPTTTMKLAVILFGLGKCGGQITVWTMSKLAFFGLFTIPKLWSTHSDCARKHGTFWFKRVRDSWRLCSYKKVIAFALFAVFWNFSSFSSRIWAVFMLLVSLRYYHDHYLAVADWTSTGCQQEDFDVASSRGGRVDVATEWAPSPTSGAGRAQRAAAGGRSLHRHRVGSAKQKKKA